MNVHSRHIYIGVYTNNREQELNNMLLLTMLEARYKASPLIFPATDLRFMSLHSGH